MKHITKQSSKQLCIHLLTIISLLIIPSLGRSADSLSGWIACPPRLPYLSQPLRGGKKRNGVNLRERGNRMWCYIADSWPRPFLRSYLLLILYSVSGQQTPAWLIGWPWLLWLWQMMTTVWPELGQYALWRSGGKLLWQGQQLAVCGSLSLGLGMWIRRVAESSLAWTGGSSGSISFSVSGSGFPCMASLGCIFCGREEPWVDMVDEPDGSSTVTLCGHFTLPIARDDLFQERAAMHFLLQLEAPGPQRSGRRTRDGRTPFLSQQAVADWFGIPQPGVSRLEKYWRDKDWANLLSLTACEVLTWDLIARIVDVCVTFPWWGVAKVYHYLCEQGVPVTQQQVRQAVEQSGWSRFRQAWAKRYRLTADSLRPRDTRLVTDLFTLVHKLLERVEASEPLTREEKLDIAQLETLVAEVGIDSPPPLKALPWLLSIEQLVFGHWEEVSDDTVHCTYCRSTHVSRKSKKPRLKKYYDAEGEVQTVEVFRYYCHNPECDKATFTNLPPGLVPYSPYRAQVHLLAVQMYGWGRSTYRRTGQALGVTSMTVYRWVSAWGYELLPIAALFGAVKSSGVVGIDEKYVLVPKNDKPAGKMRRWMYVYLAVDAHTYDLLHIALYAHNDQDSAHAFLLALRAKGYHPNVIVTDLRQDYGSVIALVFPDAEHHECIFHALQNVQDHFKAVYGAGYADSHPEAVLLKRAIYDIFNTQSQSIAQQRYQAVMSCWTDYVKKPSAVSPIFDFLEHHWPTLLNGIGDNRISTTNNTVELVIRRFDQHYQNFCGFESIDTARLYLAVFEKLYRFTPFSQDAQPRIRGKCPLQLAGYDTSQVPMASLCAGLSVQWPMELPHAHVPNQ
jgi:transposase-like protein